MIPFLSLFRQNKINFTVAYCLDHLIINLHNHTKSLQKQYFCNIIVDNPLAIPILRQNHIAYDNLIWRVRGLMPEEMLLRHPFIGRIYKIKLDFLEMKYINYCNKLWLVSSKMKEFYTQKYGINDKDKLKVIPNTYMRNAYESLYNTNFREGICYSGGISKWQQTSQINTLFNFLREQNIPVECFVPSKMLIKGQAIFKNIPVHSLSPYTLLNSLAKFRAGIIIREPNIVNAVASPFKIADYLASGLKVFMTEGIGDWQNICKKYPSIFLIQSYKKIQEKPYQVLESIRYFIF